MNRVLKVVGGALIADHVCSALNFGFSDYKREKSGHMFTVMGVDGKVHENVFVNHRGRILFPQWKTEKEIDSWVLYRLSQDELDPPTVKCLEPEDILLTLQYDEVAKSLPKMKGNILLQMNSCPDYVYDPRLGYYGCKGGPRDFRDGSFTKEKRHWIKYGFFEMSMLHWMVSLITRH